MSISTRVAALILASSIASATTITVCASGCTYTSIQTAVSAAVGGDIVEVAAGETFEESVTIPWRSDGGRVIVRSSRWRELPPPGYRVTSSHAYLMPKLQPPSTTAQALSFGPLEQYVSSVDTSTDTITFTGTHGFSNGNPIAFWHDDGTIPVVANQTYFVINATGTTLQIANLPGGSAVDLTSTPTATRFRASIARAPQGWTLQGIEIRKKDSQVTEYTLADAGTNEAASRDALPDDIIFDHVYIHGQVEQSGPRLCLFVNAKSFSLLDSTVENCQKEGEEGKAIGFVQGAGPLLFRNNYIAAGSINMLAGGDYVRIEQLVNGDSGGVTIVGNHFTRPFWTKYTAGSGGSGAPVGACSDGTYYLDTATGQWYKCTGTSWGTGPTCADGEYFRRTNVTQNCGSGACWHCSSGLFVTHTVYRGSGYNTKNLMEFKNIANAFIQGNVYENNWVNSDQSGVAVWVPSVVPQGNATWVRAENVRMQGNIVRNSAQGIRIATEGGGWNDFDSSQVSVTDNLLYYLGTTQYPSIDSNDSKPMSFAGPCDYCQFSHNTMVSGTSGGSGVVFDTAAMDYFFLANNIGYNNQYGITYDGGVGCTTYLPSPSQWWNSIFVNPDTSTWSTSSCATNVQGISNATTLFVGGGDYRLSATSPYSASCASGCQFDGTDGKDLGADVDLVSSSTGGATTGQPWLGGTISVQPGSTLAVVSYIAPTVSACTIKLYTDLARTTLSTDTDSGGEQTDSRAGSITIGTSRQVVFGTAAALTPDTTYWSTITCGSSVALQRVTTKSAGSATVNSTVQYSTSYTGEYSANYDMSSPTSISSSSTHTIPVPTGSVRYYRRTGGEIKVFVNN